MKRYLSAAAAALLLLGATAPALAGDFNKTTRAVKITPSAMNKHAKLSVHAMVASQPGKKHFGVQITTKAQAAHHFAVANIPNLAGKAKVKHP